MTASPDTRRSGCPINYALEIFGDRWTLLVLRDLLLVGRRHYKELLAADEGIASNILSDRLKRLEDRGLISKRRDPADGRQLLYGPTEAAIDLLPMLIEMTAWGARNDPQTAAPPDFVRRFEEDREGLIATYVAQARAMLDHS